MVEVENVGLQLAGWILNQKIVEHIFGPNLHVEVIKQSHVLLNFLAVEGKITNEHINVIWQASQLKHCSKQVHDLLLPLIKNLEAGPVLHLYELLKELPVKVRIKGMQISMSPWRSSKKNVAKKTINRVQQNALEISYQLPVSDYML